MLVLFINYFSPVVSESGNLPRFQLISSSGGKFDPSDINGDGALISVACEYYSQNGKLSNDHLIKYLELYPKKSYSDLEDTCKAQVDSNSAEGWAEARQLQRHRFCFVAA